ncbi:hypothetical protein RhoFasB10_03478 [Rhodococcus sp. B10]|nr:hypothetical protein [Rhodococcus sp. B10]
MEGSSTSGSGQENAEATAPRLSRPPCPVAACRAAISASSAWRIRARQRSRNTAPAGLRATDRWVRYNSSQPRCRPSWCRRERRHPDTGLCPVRHPLRVRTGLQPRQRSTVERCSGEPRRVRPTRPRRAAVHRSSRRRHCRRCPRCERGREDLVRGSQRTSAFGDLRRPRREARIGARTSLGVAFPAPADRATTGDPQGRPPLERSVRLGPLLGSGEVHRPGGDAHAGRRPAGDRRFALGRSCGRTYTRAAGNSIGPRRALRRRPARPEPRTPNRGPRPRTTVEQQICALGERAKRSSVGAAAIGNTRLSTELECFLCPAPRTAMKPRSGR